MSILWRKPTQSVRTDLYVDRHSLICMGEKRCSTFGTTDSSKLLDLLTICELAVLSFLSFVVDSVQCLLVTVGFPTTWLPAWPGALLYAEYRVANIHSSPCSILLTTELRLVVRDTETVPEELLFELRKPPQHGVLFKYTAGSPGPMATGSLLTPSLASWNFYFFLTILILLEYS